jgi:hypothetical protein
MHILHILIDWHIDVSREDNMRNGGEDRFRDERFCSNGRQIVTEITFEGYITCSIAEGTESNLHILWHEHSVQRRIRSLSTYPVDVAELFVRFPSLLGSDTLCLLCRLLIDVLFRFLLPLLFFLLLFFRCCSTMSTSVREEEEECPDKNRKSFKRTYICYSPTHT